MYIQKSEAYSPVSSILSGDLYVPHFSRTTDFNIYFFDLVNCTG